MTETNDSYSVNRNQARTYQWHTKNGFANNSIKKIPPG